MLFVHRGIAHGFLTLEDATEGECLVDGEYSKESESGVIWNNPKIGVGVAIKSPSSQRRTPSGPYSAGLVCFPDEGNRPHFCHPLGLESRPLACLPEFTPLRPRRS